MDLVVDANILFSALIKESLTSELFFVEAFHLYAPEFLFIEFSKYKEVILRKTHRTEEDFYRLMKVLERRIQTIPFEEIRNFLEDAEKISPDRNDVQYFALALKLNASIWSNDKELKGQDIIKVYTTQELAEMVKGRRLLF